MSIRRLALVPPVAVDHSLSTGNNQDHHSPTNNAGTLVWVCTGAEGYSPILTPLNLSWENSRKNLLPLAWISQPISWFFQSFTMKNETLFSGIIVTIKKLP